MRQIESSELIINKRGAIYHLDCRPEEIAQTILVVGDPERVKQISKHFDRIEYRNQHREFVTHTGFLGNKRISVCSTGIGPDNIDIVLNELDALLNIDLETRMVKEPIQKFNIIRVGTSGSLQREIPVDSFVAGTHGLGLDNLLHFYQHTHNDAENQIIQAFNDHTQINDRVSRPYISTASAMLIKEFVQDFHQGITVTCPGFYGPQGRVLRMGLSNPNLINQLTTFQFGQHRISNFEMETSAIYGMCKILGHHCLSLNAIVANRISKEFSKDSLAAIDKLILKVLETISASSI
ncbi:MAG: nucleoside phosphorylase [Sphingobacteriales bacterium]|nr:nucleoside phosphorylase [Sphingobacteriales bacterium]